MFAWGEDGTPGTQPEVAYFHRDHLRVRGPQPARALRQWWADEATLDPAPGAVGELVWGDREMVSPITLVDLDPPRRFSLRWSAPENEAATPENSLLVTLDLEPSGTGTLLLLTETGFREKGWGIAVLEQKYHEHESGWDTFLPRLRTYAGNLVSRR